MEENVLQEELYYWSPSINWKIVDGKLKIERFIYKGDIAGAFPEFYFLTQDGASIDKILEAFPDISSMKMKAFIKDLAKKKILVTSVLAPNQVFYPQKRLVKHHYSENLMYDPNEIKEYKEVVLNRNYEYGTDVKIVLNQTEDLPELIQERKSHRDFSQEMISFEQFSNLLSVFRQRREEEMIRYYYASAGGLYPIDIYLYVKPERVEKVEAGLYYYSPIDNSLSLITEKELTDEMHYYSNKEIFQSSAVSVFFLYNAQANIPKYGGNGYLYACLDTGIMVSALTMEAENLGIGLCSIGDMNFRKVEKNFQLTKDQILLHELELGLKK